MDIPSADVDVEGFPNFLGGGVTLLPAIFGFKLCSILVSIPLVGLGLIVHL